MRTALDMKSKLVLTAVAAGSSDLASIAASSGGLYPSDLYNVLEELVAQELISFDLGKYRIPQKEKILAKPPRILEESDIVTLQMPAPHPLDFDWRFSADTSDALAHRALRANNLNGLIVCLGTPSVFASLAKTPNSTRTVLLDWNVNLIESIATQELPVNLSISRCDLLSGSLWGEPGVAEVVICDPPWYSEHYVAFLGQAAYLASTGAVVMVAMLPINTRPQATLDRWSILEAASLLGLCIESLEPGRLTYETPVFEEVSLYNAGIVLETNWRYGDLLVLRKEKDLSKHAIEKIVAEAQVNMHREEAWLEIVIDSRKIKLRPSRYDEDSPPQIISIEPNDVLPTVSRRYPGRKHIDLWLWDNRVFALRGWRSIWAALHVIADRQIPDSVIDVQYDHLETAITLLRERILGVRVINGDCHDGINRAKS